MSDERCETCRFWKVIDPFEVKGAGLCRRYPPQFGREIAEQDGEEPNQGRFPWTERNDWCGEWLGREEQARVDSDDMPLLEFLPYDDSPLAKRLLGGLHGGGINYVRDLRGTTWREILKLRSVGKTCARFLKRSLEKAGYKCNPIDSGALVIRRD